jgi:bacterioferritin-associated ferredoxin
MTDQVSHPYKNKSPNYMQLSSNLGILPRCGKCNKLANTSILEINLEGKNSSVRPVN